MSNGLTRTLYVSCLTNDHVSLSFIIINSFCFFLSYTHKCNFEFNYSLQQHLYIIQRVFETVRVSLILINYLEFEF